MSERDRVRSYLYNALTLLGEAANGPTTTGSCSTATASGVHRPGLSSINLTNATSSRPSSASSTTATFPGVGSSSTQVPAEVEFQRCFPASRGRPNPDGRRGACTRFTPYFIPPSTWTHDFFLLNKTFISRTPDRAWSDELERTGLGKKKGWFQGQEQGLERKKVDFKDKKGNHEHVRETVETYFPKLKTLNGAFELMRCFTGGSGTRELVPLSINLEGYVHKTNASALVTWVHIVTWDSWLNTLSKQASANTCYDKV